jgi:hypothetical protein
MWEKKSFTVLKLLAALLLIATFTGCGAVKRYSVESYGFLPLQDHAYAYEEPVPVP